MNKLTSILFLSLGIMIGIFLDQYVERKEIKNDNPIQKLVRPKDLEKYSFKNIDYTKIEPGKLIIKEKLKEDKEYTSYLFEFEFNPNLDGRTFKKTTGQINIPAADSLVLTENKYPLIMMLRGYIDQKSFKTGDGTRNGAAYFARNGYMTVSPDFLGYGGSDSESGSILESRFQTYITALSLLKTLENKQPDISSVTGPEEAALPLNKRGQLYLWGHSNGGQILLTLLEISGVNYPAVMWAPVSKPFPYSILYYTDDSEDHGKLIRSKLAEFEETYEAENYSLTNYLDRINSPILLQQGTVDDAVPLAWSNNLAAILKNKNKDIKYFTYPGTDHNMRPMWNEVIEKDLEYYKSFSDKI